MAELAGVMVGNYFLLECMGREGMVETYRARPTTRGGYDVVLRLFRPQFPDPTGFHDNFATEVEKVWRCHHEHIQPLLEFGTGAGLLFSVTQWTETETLEQFLERQPGRFLPIPLVLRFVTQLCAALQHAHDQGIVHGNIQPSSILIRDEEHALLTNFGMKRAYEDNELVMAQIDEGNPHYIAPEQAICMLSPASDIYALGVILYHLLGGQLPYEGESSGEIAMKHANDPIPSLREIRPELPEALELVVRVALAKSPQARFPSAAALAQALLSAVMPDSPHVIATTPSRRIEVRSRRTPFTWARALSLLALTVLLFGLAGTLFFVSTLPQQIGDISNLFHNSNQPGGSGQRPIATVAATSPPRGRTATATNRNPTVVVGPGVHGHGTPQPSSTPTPVGSNPFPTGPGSTPAPTPTPLPVNCVSGSLSIDGSPNFEPLLQQVSSDYQALCSGMTISLNSDGSRNALIYLQHGRIDLAGSDLTANPGRNLTDHLMTALLYAVVVNPDVQVSQLSSAAIQGIYAGQITNWAQVGGPDEAITVILHPQNDTASAIFRSYVLGGMPEQVKGVKTKKDMPDLIAQTVAQTPGAISYVPLIFAQNANVQVIAIDGVSPSAQSLINGVYFFWTIEHLYTSGDGTAQAQAYIQFFGSPQEAGFIPQYGAVPITSLPQDVLASHLPGHEI